MLQEIGFGLIDNGILVGGAIIGFSIEDIINTSLETLLKKQQYSLKTRIQGLSGALLGAGIGNAISDFLGGWCIGYEMAFGTFFGCMLIVIVSLPIIFKIETK